MQGRYSYNTLSAQQILDILSVSAKPLSEALPIVNAFRNTEAYAKLRNKEFEQMEDIEFICFAITRKAEDTKKLTAEKLSLVLKAQEKFLKHVQPATGKHLKTFLIPLIYSEPAKAFNITKDILEKHHREYYLLVGEEKSRVLITLRGHLMKRSSHECFLNFAGLNFKNADLFHDNFSEVDLSFSDLESASLSGCNLTRANLTHTNLQKANLYNTILSDCNWWEAQLTASSFGRCEHIKFIDNIQDITEATLTAFQEKIACQQNIKNELCQALAENIVDIIKEHDKNNISNEAIRKKLDLIEKVIQHPLFLDPNAQKHSAINWLNYTCSFFKSGSYLFPTTPVLVILHSLRNDLMREMKMTVEERAEYKKGYGFGHFFNAHTSSSSRSNSNNNNSSIGTTIQVMSKSF